MGVIVYTAYGQVNPDCSPVYHIPFYPHNIPFDPNIKKPAKTESPQCVLSPFLIAGDMIIWQFL